ncbi:hypothetical protein [Kitasatospora sp. MAA19]|nr:hypothetical protein [Kitasatospora sp. MAA19]
MILVEMAEDSAPGRDLADALTRLAPGASTDSDLTATRWVVESRTPVLRVVPHPNRDACGYNPPTVHAVYSVRWSLPVLCQYRQRGYVPDCPACASIRSWEGLTASTPLPPPTDDELTHVRWEDAAEASTLRATIAAPPELDLSHLSPAELKLLGGYEQAAEVARQRQATQVRNGRSLARYNWAGLAADVVELHTTLTPPRLTPLQRVAVGGVRVYLLEQDVINARKGLAQLSRNARAVINPKTGKPAHTKTIIAAYGGITRVTLDAYLRENEPAGD